jgi:hypothetical protein
MPTQIRQPSVQTLAPATPDAGSDNLTPLSIIAILIFVLHLAGAAMLGRSQASVAQAPSISAEAGCAGEPAKNERSLPYD